MLHWSRTRYEFLSLKDILIKETKSQSNFLKRLQMRDHSILNGTTRLLGWFVVTKIPVLININYAECRKNYFEDGTEWLECHVYKKMVSWDMFLFRIFVFFFSIFFLDGKCKLFLIHFIYFDMKIWYFFNMVNASQILLYDKFKLVELS